MAAHASTHGRAPRDGAADERPTQPDLRSLHGRLLDPRPSGSPRRLERAHRQDHALPRQPKPCRWRPTPRRPTGTRPPIRPHPGMDPRDHRRLDHQPARQGSRRRPQTPQQHSEAINPRQSPPTGISDLRILCPPGTRVKVVHTFGVTRSYRRSFPSTECASSPDPRRPRGHTSQLSGNAQKLNARHNYNGCRKPARKHVKTVKLLDGISLIIRANLIE
jgi:hypothetical protein